VVYLLEDEETLRKVPSMLPLLFGTVKSPRIPILIEKQNVIALVDTGAEVSVLLSEIMTRLIGDGSRHTKLGEQKVVKPFANSDVVLKGPWLLSVAVCGHKFKHPFYSVDANVPAVIGIDVLTVAKLVVDVMNKCVYSHHHARLENRPPTSYHEPIFLVDNVSDFTPPVRPSKSASADAAFVTADVTGTFSGVGAPHSSTFSDVPSRPTIPRDRNSTSAPTAMSRIPVSAPDSQPVSVDSFPADVHQSNSVNSQLSAQAEPFYPHTVDETPLFVTQPALFTTHTRG